MGKKIDFYKARDFSEVFSDSVTFLKENFRNIGKSLVMIVAPAYVIASVMFSFFSMNFIQGFLNLSKGKPDQEAVDSIVAMYFNPVFWISLLLFFVAYMLAVGVIFSYIKLYSDSENNNITPAEVWQQLSGRLAKFFFYTLGYGAIFFVAYIILVAILVLLPNLGMLILIPLGIGLMLFFIPFISVLVPVIFYEDLSFFETVSRTIALLKGGFWKTLGVNFVAYLIVQFSVSIIYIIILVPSIIFSVSQKSFDPLYIKIVMIIYFVLIPIVLFFGYVFQYSVGSLNYFSLLEARDHVGLQRRVDTIGADADKPEEQY
jgi:hypothetical protein